MPNKSYSEAEAAYIAEQEARELEERRQQGDEPGGPFVRSRTAGRPKMTTIYSVRMSDEWVERLRSVAEAEGVPPSTLLRRWAEERLEQAEQGAPNLAEIVQETARLQRDSAQLMRQLKAAVETAQRERRATTGRPRRRAS